MLFYLALRGVGWLANQTLQFVVPLMIYRMTGSLMWSGVALFVEWTPRLVALPLAGYLADRFESRRIHILSDVVRTAVGAGAVAAVALMPGNAGVALVVLALVAGAGFELTFVAGEKAGLSLVSAKEMPRLQTMLSAIEQSCILIAPVLGGVLLLVGTTATVAVLTVLFGTSLLLARNMKPAAVVATKPPPVMAGVRQVIANTLLRDVVAITMVINLMLALLLAAAPALVRHHYGVDEGRLALVYTGAALVALLVLALLTRFIRRFGLLIAGAASALIQCLAFLAIGASNEFVAFVAIVMVFMAADAAFSAFIRTVRARAVPAAEFGSTAAAISLLNCVSMPLAGGLLAVTGASVDPVHLLTITGGLALPVVVGLLIHLRAATRTRTEVMA
ncbi:MFS transporter [Streptosporangium sp. NPDC020072]|uniref:MFS transporter n=1 Tax=Streptosporangium sp. NPDC020072 TaxID=3154788 RepID=UPI0034458E78